MTAGRQDYADVVTSTRSHAGDLAELLAAWAARAEPDARARRCGATP